MYEGRGWDYKGDHASLWNDKSIGITFMGNYMGECSARRERGCLWARGSVVERLCHPRAL